MIRGLARTLVVAVTSAALAEETAAQTAKAGAAVKIDFRALGEDGQQVTDLKADEITLKVNGKARQIQSLGLFHAAADPSPSPGGSALPVAYATNAGGHTGRVIHVLIDDDSIAPGREGQVKDAVRLMTAELARGDTLGVMTAQGQINLRPSTDYGRVQRAVDAMAGRAGSNETPADAQCRTTRVLAALGSMLALGGGSPTTIVVFAGGLTPPAQKFVMPSVGRNPDPATTTNDVCPVRPEDYENIGVLASTARAELYLFHLTDAMPTHSSAQDAGFESLAGVTGAEFIRVTAGPQGAVSRLLRETASYYVATFQAEPSERNGQTYRVDLRSSREKVKLRTRPAVEIRKDIVKTAASPKDMLRTAAVYGDLPIRAAGHTSRTAGSDEVAIVATFETLDAATVLATASVGLFDEKNTLKKQWTALPVDLTKRPVMAGLAAPAGTYRLRVAAVDAAGRAGTADYELKVELPRADPLKLSTLVLGIQAQGGGFSPRLEFAGEPVAIGLLEIYDVPKAGVLTVDLDIVQTMEGASLATAPTNIAPGRAEDMRTAYGGFSIASLPPGDYQMRAIVNLDGKPVGRVVRTLRKSQ